MESKLPDLPSLPRIENPSEGFSEVGVVVGAPGEAVVRGGEGSPTNTGYSNSRLMIRWEQQKAIRRLVQRDRYQDGKGKQLVKRVG